MKTAAILKNPALLILALVVLAAPAAADVVGGEGWSRATPPGAREAVGYLVLRNLGEEERSLMKITSTISDEVRIHRSSINSEGVAQMWPVGFLKIPPGESVRFDPNGLHVMFRELKQPLKAGDKVPLTLQFDGFEKPFTVVLEVRPLVPEKPAEGQADHRHQ
jgi:copper(I)-binding protein